MANNGMNINRMGRQLRRMKTALREYEKVASPSESKLYRVLVETLDEMYDNIKQLANTLNGVDDELELIDEELEELQQEVFFDDSFILDDDDEDDEADDEEDESEDDDTEYIKDPDIDAAFDEDDEGGEEAETLSPRLRALSREDAVITHITCLNCGTEVTITRSMLRQYSSGEQILCPNCGEDIFTHIRKK